jgi:hypothetical protein
VIVLHSFSQSTSFGHLDDESKAKLVEFLQRSNLYHTYVIELNRLRIEAIRNPSAETIDAANRYAEERIKPIRESMEELSGELHSKAFDPEKFAQMLPMALTALSQAVDFQLLLTLMGLDPDLIEHLLGKITGFLNKDLPEE